MKEQQTKSANKQKKLYIILLAVTVVAIIAAVTLSLVFGLGGNNTDNPNPIDPGINQPNDNKTNDDDKKGDDDKKDDDKKDDDDGKPIITDPEPVYVMPVSSLTHGQDFSGNTPVFSSTLKWYTTHNGKDFIADEGTSVKSVFDGEVTAVGNTILDGYYVTITHTDGVVTTYKSLLADINVEVGETVKAGTIIGQVGNTMSSEQNEGNHLHIEMKADGAFIDPMTLLEPSDK